MRFRFHMAIACAVLMLGAAPARAEEAKFANTALQAWFDKTIKADGWVVIAVDGGGIAMGDPAAVVRQPDGMLRADVRNEFLKVEMFGDYGVMSLSRSLLVNCAAGTYRTMAMEIFSHNNLADFLARRVSTEVQWATPEPGSLANLEVAWVCHAPQSGRPQQ